MAASTSVSSSKANYADVVTPTRPPPDQIRQHKVLSSIPTHMRTEVNAVSSSSNISSNRNIAGHDARKAPAPINGPLAPQPQPVSREPDRKPPLGPPPVTVTTNLDRGRSGTANPPDRPKVQPNTVAAPPPPVAVPVEEPLPDDIDESFHFYSDDDAFLANVDLGEGDLGQPVLSETDLGRPIGGEDGDSDLGRAIDPEEGLGGESAKSSPSDCHHDAERPMGPQDRSSTSLGMLSRLLPQNQNPNQQAQPQRVSAQPNNSSRNNHQTGRPPNLVHQRNENKRLPSPAMVSSNSSPSTKRRTMPSMGEFNFPPGVVSLWLRIISTLVDWPHRIHASFKHNPNQCSFLHRLPLLVSVRSDHWMQCMLKLSFLHSCTEGFIQGRRQQQTRGLWGWD